MGRCQEIKFYAFVLALQVINSNFVITNHCAQAKVVSHIGGENVEGGLSNPENVRNKLYDLYDYYEGFEEYTGQRVVDLDQAFEDYGGQQVVDLDEYEYELDRKSSAFITEDGGQKPHLDNYEKSGLHGLTSPAMKFDIRCPDLPPRPVEDNHSLCAAKPCKSDEDCVVDSGQQSIFTPQRGQTCCFNGCVLACLSKNDPPKAFDWVEDTDAQRNQELDIGTRIGEKLKSLVVPSLAHDEEESAPNKVILPGGCAITLQQMEELQLFRKYDHVDICTCKNGEVVCHVKVTTPSPHEPDAR